MNMSDLVWDLVVKAKNGQDDSAPHVMTLFAIALSIKAKRILELGVRSGITTEPLIAAAIINDGTLDSVDIVDCFEGLAMKPSNFTFYQKDAIQFLQEVADKGELYDLIFVDDWHSYAHVKKELELIDRITDNKSIVLLHDTMICTAPSYNMSDPREEFADGGPCRAVMELDRTKYEYSTIPVSHGLTILRKIKTHETLRNQ